MWNCPFKCVSVQNVCRWGAWMRGDSSVNTVWAATLNYFPVLFYFCCHPHPVHLLSPFYWHCHRHSTRAADWMRRWVRVEEGTVLSALCVFPPRLLECKRGGGLQTKVVMNTAPHSLPEQASPLLSLVSCPPVSYVTVRTPCLVGLCVLESRVGQTCPLCRSAVFKRSNIWCIYCSCNSLAAQTELTLKCFKMHHIDLEKEAFQTHQNPSVPDRKAKEQEGEWTESQNSLLCHRLSWRSVPVTSSQFSVKSMKTGFTTWVLSMYFVLLDVLLYCNCTVLKEDKAEYSSVISAQFIRVYVIENVIMLLSIAIVI